MKEFPPMIESLESRIAPAAFTVTTLADKTDAAHDTGSLRDAIIAANASTDSVNTIVFDVHGTITLAANLPAISLQSGSSLSIAGPKAGKDTGIVLNGNDHLIFSVLSGAVSFQDLTVTNGAAAHGGGVIARGGGLYVNDSSAVALTDVKISHNHAVGRFVKAEGGGIYIAEESNVTISKSTITGNLARGTGRYSGEAAGYGAQGGGIACLGTLTMENSVVSDNAALGQSDTGAVGLTGGAAKGGGLYIGGGAADVTITGSTISGNKAIGGGGGFGQYYRGGSAGGAGNGGAANGGGIEITGGMVTISTSKITANAAHAGNGGAGPLGVRNPFHVTAGTGGNASGGGISNPGGNLTLNTSTLSGNLAAPGLGSKNGIGTGGGIYGSGTVNAFEITVAENRANDGGGVALSGAGNTILGSTISGNRARTGGGVQVAPGAALTIQDSTVANNSAVSGGGGLYLGNGSMVNIHNDTVAGNSVSTVNGLGGGVESFGTTGTVSIISTIIAGNKGSNGADLFSESNAVVSLSFDLIQTTPTEGTFADNGNNIFNESPQLGRLANNGGPTLTMLPSLNSPVVNTGDNPDGLANDQRGIGFARTAGTGAGASDGTDIGAVELQVV